MSTINMRALEQLVQDVHDGNENPLKAYGILKQIEGKCKTYISEIEGAAQEAAAKYTEKTFTDSGFIFEKRAGGKSHNFKGIPEFDMAQAHLDSVKEKYKTKGGELDEETGEILPMPKITYRKDSLILKNK